MQEQETRGDKCWLAAVIIGMAVPHSCEKEYWITQQRLLAHADRFTGCSSGEIDHIDDIQRYMDKSVLISEYLDNLGSLYAG